MVKVLFSNMGIVKKMVLGYFIIIFVPVIALGFYYYNQLYENMIEDYASSKQQVVEQAYSSLQMELLQVESNSKIFQYNSNVVSFLSGDDSSKSDYYYRYLKDVRPVVSHAFSSNSNIEDLRIYFENEKMYPAPDIILPWKNLSTDVQAKINQLVLDEGKWFLTLSDSNVSSLTYFQKMYNGKFTKQIGVLAIEVNPALIQGLVTTLENENRSDVHLLPKNITTDPIYDSEELLTHMMEEDSGYIFLNNKRLVINHLLIDKLGIRIAVASQAEDIFVNLAEKQVILIVIIIGFLLILSGIYYLLAASVTRRILKLARHMRNVGDNNFKLIEHKQDQDEIGYLTSSYNLMLNRIDELVNKVQKSELLRKEAAYKVLQAQIQPHFLYNTLEMIRMLAETNEDKEVADITFSLGRLMRYSLSNRNKETQLNDEIAIIGHYMRIHKMRLGKRLDYHFKVRANVNKIPCPRFILQPLVENCIIHGLSPTQKCCRIDVAISENLQYVYVEISDNGVGIPEKRLTIINSILNNSNQVSGEESLGLYNVSERIKLFYGEDSRMEITSKENEGTKITLYLSKKGMTGNVKTIGYR